MIEEYDPESDPPLIPLAFVFVILFMVGLALIVGVVIWAMP